MKAIVVHEFGGPEVLKLEEVPTPKPAAGQVLVRVHAVGVNPYDTYMRNQPSDERPVDARAILFRYRTERRTDYRDAKQLKTGISPSTF
jgi:threonine dehydrogenase-like Zn-dependent dehydrogenase